MITDPTPEPAERVYALLASSADALTAEEIAESCGMDIVLTQLAIGNLLAAKVVWDCPCVRGTDIGDTVAYWLAPTQRKSIAKLAKTTSQSASPTPELKPTGPKALSRAVARRRKRKATQGGIGEPAKPPLRRIV